MSIDELEKNYEDKKMKMNKIICRILSLCFVIALFPLAMVSATTYPAASDKYDDVTANKWYVPYISYAVSKGYMSGTSSSTFEPDGNVTRAQYVQVLYAMAGKPNVTKKSGFKDVKDGSWYEKAVNWAADVGVTSGLSANKFGTTQAVTREQAVTFFKAYTINVAEKEEIISASLDGFSDAGRVSNYAVSSMRWAVGTKLVTGNRVNNKTLLDPKGVLTRAQLATMLTSFDKYLNENAEKEESIYLCVRESISNTDGYKIEYNWEYDEHGNNISLTQREADWSSNNHQILQTRTIDANGKIIKETWHEDGIGTYIIEYNYDSNDQIKQTKGYYQESEAKYVTVINYTYDSNGNLITEDNKTTGEKTQYKYDEEGLLVERTLTYDNGNKDVNYYTYDGKGNLITLIYKDSGGTTFTYKYSYEYDEEGKILIQNEYESINSSKVAEVTKFEYDEYGNVTKETKTTDDRTSIHEYAYKKYDVKDINKLIQDPMEPVFRK